MLSRRIARGAGLVLWTAVLVEGAPGQQPTLRDQIVAQERAGLDALKAGDTAAFAALIADEGVFVDAAGPAPKPDVVKHVAEFHLKEYTRHAVRSALAELRPNCLPSRGNRNEPREGILGERPRLGDLGTEKRYLGVSVQSGDRGQIATGAKPPAISVRG